MMEVLHTVIINPLCLKEVEQTTSFYIFVLPILTNLIFLGADSSSLPLLQSYCLVKQLVVLVNVKIFEN